MSTTKDNLQKLISKRLEVSTQLSDLKKQENSAYKAACLSCKTELVELLIKHGHAVDLGLKYACKGNQPVIVKLLLNKGANLEKAFDLAAEFGRIKIMKFLISMKNLLPEDFRLKRNINKINISVVRILLKNTKIIFGRDQFGQVCRFGNLKLVKLFVKYKRKINKQYGFEEACYGGQKSICKFLVRKGVDKSGYYEYLEEGFVSAGIEHDIETLQRMINKKLVDYNYALNRIWNTANLWKWKPHHSSSLILRLIQLGADYKDLEFEPKHRYAKKLMAEKGCTKCFDKKNLQYYP